MEPKDILDKKDIIYQQIVDENREECMLSLLFKFNLIGATPESLSQKLSEQQIEEFSEGYKRNKNSRKKNVQDFAEFKEKMTQHQIFHTLIK